MFSKQRVSWVLSLILAVNLLGLSACTDFLDEKRQEPQTMEMANARFACLQALPVEINKFIRGEVSDRDIRSGFECSTDALLYFKNKTKGTYPDAYALEDLRNFFGKYFLKKNNVTPAFAAELFKLKKVLVGGSDKTITKAEIQKLMDILDVLKEQAVLIAPHVTTLLGRKQDPAWSEVDNAMTQLSQSLGILLRQVDLINSTYSFEDLKKFMDGLDAFINASETFYLTEQLSGNIPLVEVAKNILIGDNARLDNLHDWQVALKMGIGLYKEILRYRYFLRGKEIDSPRKIQSLLLIADDAFQLLEESLPMQAHGAISFANIDALLDQLQAKAFLPMNLSSLALKETYKKIILRILDPRRRGDSRGLYSLERTHVLALKHELKIYQIHQHFIDQLKFDSGNSVSFDELKSAANSFSAVSYVANTLRTETLEQESLLGAWSEGAGILIKKHPILFNKSGRLVVGTQPQLFRQSWASLTKWNLMRALTRFLLLGYGERRHSHLFQEEMLVTGLEQWYADFNKLGIEIKAFDPRSHNSGARSFMEANFFTFNGNGDSLMNHQETFDFVSFLVSGGMTSSEGIRQHLLTTHSNCVLNEKDIFGFPVMKEDCFKAGLRKNFAIYFDNLPGLVREVTRMSDSQWNEFYLNLVGAARVSETTGGKIETADIRTAVMVLHYTESLMSVFDVDNSGKLNADEIRSAAPRFYEFMKAESPSDARFMVTDFFLYLVYKGKKPTLGSYAYFQAQKAFGSLEDVGRDKILRVFKVLKDEAAKK